ncbi:cytochrome P450, putative [Pediculus humanus corporis]|uniref:Cytochrome P450, putative n=1 Tax=Pediculus humanus subsp. corporis TaxID=121224 RepID=E0VMW9_PEDHC|nr:cytochrome P450, putative [Pediculus humanus corporis]EEB14725.1 cytochrome P450, putative [Pediculus humanus corporis]
MKTIPSPKSLPFIGTTLSILANGGPSKLHLYVDKRHKELGPIYREKLGPVSAIFVSDGDYMRKIFALEGKYPKHIIPESWMLYNEKYNCKRGLLFMENEEWFNYRKIMNNSMLKIGEDKYVRESIYVAENLIENWKSDSVVENLEKQLYKWSLEVMIAILLGTENYSRNKFILSPFVENLSQKTHRIFIESATLSLLPVQIVAKLNFPVWKRFVAAANSAMEQGREIVEKLMDMNEKNPIPGGLLQELSIKIKKKEDLIRIVIDLILAAGDTTAYTMLWSLYLLSKNETTQKEIYNEIIKEDDNNNNNTQNVFNLPLLKGCLRETLRLYPVAPFITRFMPEDTILNDYKINANELVLLSLYSSGRNEKYFPDSKSFYPQRWLRCGDKYKGVTNPTASLPFAMGSRSCIGKKIAETQILIALSTILKNYEVRLENDKEINMVLHLISVPAEPIKIMLKSRK